MRALDLDQTLLFQIDEKAQTRIWKLPELIAMDSLNFPNLKASTLKLEILQNLKGFGPFLMKIKPGALFLG